MNLTYLNDALVRYELIARQAARMIRRIRDGLDEPMPPDFAGILDVGNGIADTARNAVRCLAMTYAAPANARRAIESPSQTS